MITTKDPSAPLTTDTVLDTSTSDWQICAFSEFAGDDDQEIGVIASAEEDGAQDGAWTVGLMLDTVGRTLNCNCPWEPGHVFYDSHGNQAGWVVVTHNWLCESLRDRVWDEAPPEQPLVESIFVSFYPGSRS